MLIAPLPICGAVATGFFLILFSIPSVDFNLLSASKPWDHQQQQQQIQNINKNKRNHREEMLMLHKSERDKA